MDTVSLKYFMEIASGKTFWEVSENHNISQSSVSKAILRLEEELNVKLFSREKRAAQLTTAGIMFYESLKKLEPEFNNTLAQLAQYSRKKNIVLGINPSTDYLDLNMRIPESRFFQENPDITVTIIAEKQPRQAITKLMQGELDFSIGHYFKHAAQFCDYDVVCQDTLYAIFPKDHPLAGRESVTFQELMDEKILVRSLIIQDVIQDTCDALALPPPPNLTVFDVPSSQLRRDHLINRVAFGHGITLYFLSDLYMFNLKHVSVCPVAGCPDFPVVLNRKKGKKLAAYQEAFRRHLCDVIFADKDWLSNR